MALAAVGQKYLITFVGSVFNQTILNTFWYQLSAVPAGTTVAQVYTFIRSAIIPINLLRSRFLQALPDNYNLDQTWIQCVDPNRFAKALFVDNLPGLMANGTSTQNAAAVITRRGEEANRRNVGSLHLVIGDTGALTTSGVITDAGYITALNNLATEMKNNLTDGGTPPTTLIPVLFNPARAPGGLAIPIVSTNVQLTTRTMRRRTVGLGI